jgi:hypothetical protein
MIELVTSVSLPVSWKNGNADESIKSDVTAEWRACLRAIASGWLKYGRDQKIAALLG